MSLPRTTIAASLASGDTQIAAALSTRLLRPLRNNFVERPWGGIRIRDYKCLHPLPDQPRISGAGLGEAFEIAAFDADTEAREHPSRLRFDDGSEMTLPDLLRRHARVLLGDAFCDRYGESYPLLPKTLDIKELLSVQGHPQGHTEVYVILYAEPGATIRLGFRADIEPRSLIEELTAGRDCQQRLLERLRAGGDGPRADGAQVDGVHGDGAHGNGAGAANAAQARLHALLQPWLAARGAGVSLPAEVEALFHGSDRTETARLLEDLKRVYWHMLDSMNEVPVAAGQVLYNANPERIVAATDRRASAEVHALGNPEQREILMLEIRRPGPTFRAWDNVRFPMRRVDVEAAVAALNLQRTDPQEFVVDAVPVPGRAGVFASVRCDAFGMQHLRPQPGRPVAVSQQPPHSLHVVAGGAEIHAEDGVSLGSMTCGESAVVPVGVGGYHVAAAEGGRTEIVKVDLPI